MPYRDRSLPYRIPQVMFMDVLLPIHRGNSSFHPSPYWLCLKIWYEKPCWTPPSPQNGHHLGQHGITYSKLWIGNDRKPHRHHVTVMARMLLWCARRNAMAAMSSTFMSLPNWPFQQGFCVLKNSQKSHGTFGLIPPSPNGVMQRSQRTPGATDDICPRFCHDATVQRGNCEGYLHLPSGYLT